MSLPGDIPDGSHTSRSAALTDLAPLAFNDSHADHHASAALGATEKTDSRSIIDEKGSLAVSDPVESPSDTKFVNGEPVIDSGTSCYS